MDSAREEVRAKLEGFAAALGASKPLLMANIDGFTDAIMSAFKRGAGVVVKELEWRQDGHILSASALGLQYHIATYEGMSKPYKVIYYWAGDPDDPMRGHFDTLEAAKAACQADFAKRITSAVEPSEEISAVEPSCVVTDEMAIRALRESARISAEEDGDDYVDPLEEFSKPEYGENGVRDQIDAEKRILTAALSSRTEEEVHRHFVRDVANLSLSGEVTDEDEGTIFDPWPHEQHECLEKLIRRARDIKGGVSDV